MTAALIRCGVNRFRILRIDHDIGDAGVLADIQYVLPRFGAVSRLEKPSVSTRTPQRSLRRDVNDVRIFRINGYAADVF